MSERKKILYISNRRFSCGGRDTYRKGDMYLELIREELARQHDVFDWGWGYRYNWIRDRQLSDVIDFCGTPDIVLTHDFFNYIPLGISNIDAVKAHIISDYYHGLSEHIIKRYTVLLGQYDVLLASYYTSVRLAKERIPEKKCIFWPGSVDTNFFRNYHKFWSSYVERPIDVYVGMGANQSLYGPDRGLIREMVNEMGKNGLHTKVRNKYWYDYVDTLNLSKIFISNNSKYDFMPKKVLEAMACGTFLLTDKCEEFDMMGIEDGKHVVIYKDLDDLRDKIHYYLENDSERKEIALAGYRLVVGNFSMLVAVRKMVEIILDV